MSSLLLCTFLKWQHIKLLATPSRPHYVVLSDYTVQNYNRNNLAARHISTAEYEKSVFLNQFVAISFK